MARQDLSLNDVVELRAKLRGRPVIASISGGKDSGAMALFLRELGIEFTAVFMDTGWESAVSYEYIRGPLTNTIGPITEIRADKQMVELIRHKAMFASRQHRFCTDELKMKPFQRYIASLDAEVVSAVGIRAVESPSRALMAPWEWSDGLDCDVWRPLLTWTLDDVIAIHARHNLRPNPLYMLAGVERVGCWPCVLSKKSEIRAIAEHDPARIAVVRELEIEIGKAIDVKHAARGETAEQHAACARPAWFQQPDRVKGRTWPVDAVVEWSRTKRGGKEPELFAGGAADAGCMRWGLCDTAIDTGSADE